MLWKKPLVKNELSYLKWNFLAWRAMSVLMWFQQRTCSAPFQSGTFSNSLSVTRTVRHLRSSNLCARLADSKCSRWVSEVFSWWTIVLKIMVDATSSPGALPGVTMSSYSTVRWDTKVWEPVPPALKLVSYWRTMVSLGFLRLAKAPNSLWISGSITTM